MVSPIPKHLRDECEVMGVRPDVRYHVTDLNVDPSKGVDCPGLGKHRAKYAPGLATVLVELAGSRSIGDPMAGTGTISRETGMNFALNDIDVGMTEFLDPLGDRGCEVSYLPATEIKWHRDVCIFSPPYYPRTDRRKPNAHNDDKRGAVVGFRDSYSCQHPQFVGNPGGASAIRHYRVQMEAVYRHLYSVCDRMIVVTKNWTRLGTELRLDLDTILMAQDHGWDCIERHGWVPPPSLWSQFNAKRGGGVQVEDVLVFSKQYPFA